MKFEIEQFFDNYYYIILDGLDFNDEHSIVAKYLGLTKDKYINILISHNATKPITYVYYYFNNKEDAKKVIKTLEPYLIMTELTK